MRCPNCLHPVAEHDSRCSRCGAALPLSGATTLSEATGIPYRPSLDFPPGSRFAERYTIIEKIGEGGMGVVYKALDTVLDQQVVALKLIQPSLASIPTFVQRFKREVRLTRKVAHPNVCRVHDLGEGDGVLYLSMEWIGGETLGRLLQKAGALEQDRALEIAERIAQALAAAHAKGIVHRDLKPGNVMLTKTGAKLLDFGLARTGRGGPGRAEPDGLLCPPQRPPAPALASAPRRPVAAPNHGVDLAVKRQRRSFALMRVAAPFRCPII